MRPLRHLLLGLAALAIAAPLAAYTIYLKNGSIIEAKEKYSISQGKAFITLINGQHTFIDAAQIDVARTDRGNQQELGGNAKVIDNGTKALQDTPQPPPPQELSNLIENHTAQPRSLPQARRPTPGEATSQPQMSKGGYLDLTTLARRPYPSLDIASEVQQFFRLQGLEELTVWSGSAANRPLIDVTTNSEGSVFQALTTAANALLHLRDRFPGKVAALELVMTTPNRERAGQFVLTPELAADLVAKRVDATAFFVTHVQF